MGKILNIADEVGVRNQLYLERDSLGSLELCTESVFLAHFVICRLASGRRTSVDLLQRGMFFSREFSGVWPQTR